MNDFTATLAEFRAGRCEFAELEAAFGRLAAASPTEIDAALALVDEHYRAGHFPTQLYAVLRSRAKAAPASDAGKTRLRPAEAPADAGKTRLRPAEAAPDDAGKTRLAESPAAAAPADDGRTRLRPQRPVTGRDAPPSTPTTGTRDEIWRNAAAEVEDVPDVEAGFVLKGRFVLEQEVGRGGMGVVFRARDLRKEEAQDRDPFVAIKILNDEFRRHPESLKALQREARKAQNLAHPNIATVFDFDRDGAIVYIQMEFLQGRPLDVVIRESGGMPYREAYPLIAGMGRALSYAHGLGIVHSDFKPGNCFATAKDVVKVFDFGIARAAKIQGAARDELTRFDAGTLGALTPAYASCEMLDGMEPDPRDDIYALGCVAYELLTGKHPFGKVPATEARAKKLTPPVVKGITPRQQRALQRTLAFRRDDRTRTVAEFLEGVGEHKLNKTQIATGAVAALAVAGVGFMLVQGALQERRTEALVADLGSGAPERVEPALEALGALEAAQQTTVLQAAREPLVTYFVELVDAAFDPDRQRYDYAAADAVLAKARALITDSDGLGEAKRSIDEKRNQLIVRMGDELTAHIDAGRLLPVDGADATDVLDVLRQAAPDALPAGEAQVLSAAQARATRALDSDDVAQARALIDFGLARAPNDASLLDLNDRLTAAVNENESAAAPAATTAPTTEGAQRQALAALLAAPAYDAAWEASVRDLLASLERTLPAADSTVADARTRVAQLYVDRAKAMRDRERFSEAARLLRVADGFVPSFPGLAAELAATEEARLRFTDRVAEEERVAAINRQRTAFNAATGADDRIAAGKALDELRRRLKADDEFLTREAPAAMAAMAERLAKKALDAGRLDEAERRALDGLEAAPRSEALQTLLGEIRSARASAAASNTAPPSTAPIAAPTSVAPPASTAAASTRAAGQPCTIGLATYGGSGTRGQCWDMIDAQQQGPRLVVVPKGDGIEAPYAIGRFEIAVAQWNVYCRSSGACTPLDQADTDPLANITLAQARAYAQWLSEKTGARYRLPTTAEWQHAVAAPRAARNDDNCVVPAAGRGGTPRSVTQGQQNDWGLLNYLGNVQEWTDIGGGAVEARGGNYREPLQECVATQAAAHDGSADAVTGFRLVREITGL